MIKDPGKQRYSNTSIVAGTESMEGELCKRLHFQWQEQSRIANEEVRPWNSRFHLFKQYKWRSPSKDCFALWNYPNVCLSLLSLCFSNFSDDLNP